jgi:hypothetical protein
MTDTTWARPRSIENLSVELAGLAEKASSVSMTAIRKTQGEGHHNPRF